MNDETFEDNSGSFRVSVYQVAIAGSLGAARPTGISGLVQGACLRSTAAVSVASSRSAWRRSNDSCKNGAAIRRTASVSSSMPSPARATDYHHCRGLARGMSVARLLSFYKEFGVEAFTKRSIFERWKSLYENGALRRSWQAEFGASTTLQPEHLQCLPLVVTRNATTDSAWPIFSNPVVQLHQRDRKDCNLRIRSGRSFAPAPPRR